MKGGYSDFLYPTLCDPIDGKNTGVGCHFLLQCMKVKSESEVAQSCPTLSDPMDSIHGIFQARVLEWGAVAFSKNLFNGYLIRLEICFFLKKCVAFQFSTVSSSF